MHIVEQKLVARTGRAEGCEDRLVVTEWFSCVVDGVTFKGSSLINEKTPGHIAANLICNAVRQLPADVDCRAAIDHLTRHIDEFCVTVSPAKERDDYRRRIAASVAILSRKRREVWSVGDCQVLIGGRVFANRNRLDMTMSDARALYLQSELLKGKSVDELIDHDTGREFILPLLNRQKMFLNIGTHSEFSYIAVCGVPLPENVTIEPIPVPPDVTEVVLASDGYPKVAATLAASEEFLREALEQDPLCIGVARSTKGLQRGNVSFDDRAYLRVVL